MEHSLKAIYLAKEIPISRLRGALEFRELSVTRETAVYRLNGAMFYVYSFGSIVLLDCPPEEENALVSKLASMGLSMKEKRLTEEYSIVQDPAVRKFIVTDTRLLVRRMDQGMLKVIARVLAQSVALESYEEAFDRTNLRFLGLNQELERRGRLGVSSREVMRMIARNNTFLEEVVSGIGVLEKPDSAWESHLLDSLHTRLVEEFELRERFSSLHSGMEFLQENYKVFLESLRSRYEARLEWIIILLIVVEIVLFLYELWWR